MPELLPQAEFFSFFDSLLYLNSKPLVPTRQDRHQAGAGHHVMMTIITPFVPTWSGCHGLIFSISGKEKWPGSEDARLEFFMTLCVVGKNIRRSALAPVHENSTERHLRTLNAGCIMGASNPC